MAKILNISRVNIGRTVKGTNFVKGDYIPTQTLFETKTTEGIFNLSRNEVLNLLAPLGIVAVKLTASVLSKLIGTHIDVSTISDK
ncbi:MAG: hypothetical protein K2L14_08665 [Duncaniella sp.]|nr:hypothetical protein [Duncaniella sp.]